LKQRLATHRQLAEQASAIMDSFDRRIGALEAAVKPLHKKANKLKSNFLFIC
jgi:hypothetical protein